MGAWLLPTGFPVPLPRRDGQIAVSRFQAVMSVQAGSARSSPSGASRQGSAWQKRRRDARRSSSAEMRAIAAGDPEAFQRLIDRESPRLLRFARACSAVSKRPRTRCRTRWSGCGRTPSAGRRRRDRHVAAPVCYNRWIDRLRRRRNFVDDGRARRAIPTRRNCLMRGSAQNELALSLHDAIERLPHARSARQSSSSISRICRSARQRASWGVGEARSNLLARRAAAARSRAGYRAREARND